MSAKLKMIYILATGVHRKETRLQKLQMSIKVLQMSIKVLQMSILQHF